MQQNNPIKSEALIAAAKAIDTLGGPVEAARKVGAPSYQSVQSWRNSGVPVRFCARVRDLTGMSLQVLRPNDWHQYWPDMPKPRKPKQATTA